MSRGTSFRELRKSLVRIQASVRYLLLHMGAARLLLMGYLSYIMLGWLLLSLPAAQQTPVSALDNLFIAASAVSTTGLVTVDPGGSYSFFGELVVLLLIQLGGLGYMTVSSFVVLALLQHLGKMREYTIRSAFNLPGDVRPSSFVLSVVLFTLACETAGAAALYAIFSAAGVNDPLWSAIFHSVSAFCTAGFSLNANSFEDFRGHVGLNVVISALSILGAMGFLIVVDAWRTLTGKSRHLGFTSRVILRVTAIFLAVGTFVLMVAEPGIAALPLHERALAAFFQTMTASTTVGFNTHPIGTISGAILIVLFFLMIVGASPAGTGGGLKTTSFAALAGLMRSTLKRRAQVTFFNRELPQARIYTAGASLAYYAALLLIASFLLLLTETGARFEVVVFEVISAMGTVGLSMGLTGQLSEPGKLIVIVLMVAGRVGILSFGIALATRDQSAPEQGDNELVL